MFYIYDWSIIWVYFVIDMEIVLYNTITKNLNVHHILWNYTKAWIVSFKIFTLNK